MPLRLHASLEVDAVGVKGCHVGALYDQSSHGLTFFPLVSGQGRVRLLFADVAITAHLSKFSDPADDQK